MEMNTNQVNIRIALPTQRIKIRDFHFKNHLEESGRTQQEREEQTNDLQEDMPQLLFQQVYEKCSQWIAEINGQIVGCIGIHPKEQHTWLCNFSVDPRQQKKGIGRKLLNQALTFGRNLKKPIRLFTFDNYTGGYDIMGSARKMYKLNGFQVISRQEIQFGKNRIQILIMELK